MSWKNRLRRKWSVLMQVRHLPNMFDLQCRLDALSEKCWEFQDQIDDRDYTIGKLRDRIKNLDVECRGWAEDFAKDANEKEELRNERNRLLESNVEMRSDVDRLTALLLGRIDGLKALPVYASVALDGRQIPVVMLGDMMKVIEGGD